MRIKSSFSGFQLPEPEFRSRLTDLIIELEFLRKSQVATSTDPSLYKQLREIFRDMDSVASTRIDGNKTGLSKFLEAKEEEEDVKGRKTIEIDNSNKNFFIMFPFAEQCYS